MAPNSPSTASGLKPLVLVVDDNEDNRRIYADGLAWNGFRVEEACDGTNGIEVARSVMPEVIVMDLAMPGVDGVEATRILKRDPSTRSIGIVALTAYGEPSLRARVREAGADFYVTKPCIPSELAVHVHECIRRRRR
jgi:two-component system, cell cycle response regulator DivK